MDNRRLVIGMLLALGLMILWLQGVQYIYKKFNYDPNWQQKQQAATTTQPTTAESAGTAAASPGTAPTTLAGGLKVAPATAPAVAKLGSTDPNDPVFHLGVTIQPQGAGIDSVILNQFTKTPQGKEPYGFQYPYTDSGPTIRSLATRSVTIDGNAIDLSTVDWSLESSTDDRATYAVAINGESGPLARVRKTYQLSRGADQSQGYELLITQTIENLAGRDLKVRTALNGPTLPPREQDRGAERQILTGYPIKGSIDVTHDAIEYFTKDRLTKDYTKDKDGHPLAWIGTSSIYFNALIYPVPLDDPKSPASYIDNVTATLLNPGATDTSEHEMALAISTTELPLAAGASSSLSFRTYLGPRQRSVLNSAYYASFPVSYDQTLVLTSGPCAVCTFQWLINVLVMLLRSFYWVWGGFAGHGDWGLAIISLVVIVRVMLHPITKRSQISMSRMSKMGPEMERLKKKYGENKDELNKAMMGMYKEQGVAPVLGCLPMFLQMPIWIALWQSLQTTFELRHAPFLWGLTWIHDLSKPDHLFTWTPIPLVFGWQISALNVLPLLLAVVFWLQAKMQPKPVAATPEQAQQQKMMQWMTLLFPLMLYTGPSGLNLYIMTSTGIGIVESKIVRDHIKQREEEEKAGRVIVDAGKKFKGGKGGSDSLGMSSKAKKPAGGLMGKLAELMQRAEQMAKDNQKRK